MTATMNQARIYLQHRWVIFWSFFIPVVALVTVGVFSHQNDGGDSWASTFTLFALVAVTAFCLASIQQEMLNKSVSFLMPRVRQGMRHHQLIMGGVVFVLSFLATLFVPGLTTVVQGSWSMSVSLACLMLVGYTLTLLLVFQFASISFMSYRLSWLGILLIMPMQKLPLEYLQNTLAHTSVMVITVALVIYLAWQQMCSWSTHRNLVQRAYISVVDVRKAERVEEYKRARNQHKTERSGELRPLAGLLQALNRRVAISRAGQHHVRALVWEAAVLWLSSSLPRSRWLIALYLTFFPLALALTGYYGSWRALQRDESAAGILMGLVFGAAATISGMMAFHLRRHSLGRLFDRRSMLQAGWLGAGVMAVLGLTVGLVLFGLGHLLASILPAIMIRGHLCTVVAPSFYLVGATLFVLPAQLLVFVGWRKPQTPVILQQAGLLAFYAYLGAFLVMEGKVEWSMSVVPAVLWVATAVVWRWRVLHRDQI